MGRDGNEMSRDYNSKVEGFCRGLILEYLDQCSAKQIELFNRMYGGIDQVTLEQARIAYIQCRRTVEEVNAKT